MKLTESGCLNIYEHAHYYNVMAGHSVEGTLDFGINK